VTFTPGFQQFARDSFVFENAFTRYGGTWLAMPSIWAGGEVTRRWGASGFDRMNALEKLVLADGYRLIINDYTVAQHLLPTTAVTRLDPDVPSVNTDLCHLVGSLLTQLEATAAGAQPIFAFLAPMNVHILNTRLDDGAPSAGFAGFYAPYASRLQRLDACFARFVTDLKQRGLYDDSVIVVTSDHGDSLGEGGNWGHQQYLFPEDVRLPLIVHVPARRRAAMTTDLGRVTFSTDIAPTLYGLVGHSVRDLGPTFGMPLFVASDSAPESRRRSSFLLVSSYGPTFGLLRQNGRSLYVADATNSKAFAFDLSGGLLGSSVDLSDNQRRRNQRAIRVLATGGAPPSK
jgi:hypothetical protein